MTGAAVTGERIRKLRESQRWSQAELARRLGGTAVMISNYETGRSQIKSDELPRWAAALEVPPTAFHEPYEDFVRRCVGIFQVKIMALAFTRIATFTAPPAIPHVLPALAGT